MSEIRIYMRHCRPLGICTGGIRAWIISHGFNYRDSVLHGIPISEMEATGDPFAMKICEVARKEAQDEQG